MSSGGAELEKLLRRVEISPNDAKTHLSLAAELTRAGDVDKALEHAEEAARLSRGGNESQLRRAICLWRLHRYGEAKALAAYFGDSPEALTWKQLILNRPEPAADVPCIPPTPKGTGTTVETPQDPDAPSVTSAVAGPSGAAPSVAPSAPAAKFDWFQRGDEVEIVLYRKGLNNSSTRVAIEPHRLRVESDGFEWTQAVAPAFDTAASTHRVTAYKVEFVLRKLDTRHWDSLDGAVAEPAPVERPLDKWDSLQVPEEDAEKSDDPDDFFRKVYAEGTPELRRAMTKSFVESNGTSLSTNWDDVKSRTFETVPPEDMVAKKWE